MANNQVDSLILQRAADDESDIEKKLSDIEGRITQVALKMSSITISSASIIKTALINSSKGVMAQRDSVMSLRQSLNQINNLYEKTEINLLNQGENISNGHVSSASDMQNSGDTYYEPGAESDNSHANWWDKLKECIIGDEDDKETLSFIDTLLKISDEWGDKKEAGALEGLTSYIESLMKFLTGDKSGMTGFGDFFNLADSSVGAWKGLYDYFGNMFKEAKTGFFGEMAKKNVEILGLSAGIMGLTSSILSASSDIDEKKWQSIIADYIDCGKNIVTVVKSGYKLEHIKDVKSLADIKAGPWSALNVYAAVGTAGINTVSQGFRSYEKYYADGEWDIVDTAATGIDISMAGLYGISHTLTLGLDNLIFGAINPEGESELSYIEQAAEGYKILAKNCGESIKKWWNGLFR